MLLSHYMPFDIPTHSPSLKDQNSCDKFSSKNSRKKGIKQIQCGLELELLLVDKSGSIVPRASEIVNHSTNDGSIVDEFSSSVIELVPDPSSCLNELADLLLKSCDSAKQIAKNREIQFVPSSMLGDFFSSEPIETPRFQMLKEVFTEKEFEITEYYTGTHLHIDKLHTHQKLDQYNLMTAMDPAFVFLSTTPFTHGQHKFKDHRILDYRYGIFPTQPELHQLSPYAKSLEEVRGTIRDRHEAWCSKVESHGFSRKEVREVFDDLMKSHWGPVRWRDKTIEVRSGDACLPSYVIAFAALYLGAVSRIQQENLTMKTEWVPTHQYFNVNNSSVIIPPFKFLLELEERGAKVGFEDDDVHEYLLSLLEFAEVGLDSAYQIYLDPFREMLDERLNISDRLLAYSEKSDDIAEIRLLLAKWYEDDMKALKSTAEDQYESSTEHYSSTLFSYFK